MIVCAADVPDEPIIYCSEGFEALTQYHSSEVLGQNCRFLQENNSLAKASHQPPSLSPDLDVKNHLKTAVAARQETRVQILNYKKSGEPFTNLLSVIPVTWDSDEVKYLVGFMAGANRWNS